MKHGDSKLQHYSMGEGTQNSVKPVRFCQIHGWVEAFQWAKHETCGCGLNGAAVVTTKVEVMRKAA